MAMLEVALEALKRCYETRHCTPQRLLVLARICRVENVMRPYLEVLA